MDRDIPLGRIAGIKVGMNPTVLLLGAIYAYILATNWLPITQPDHRGGVYWAAGAGGALLIFLSLLVHEIGHALVARDEGIGVRSMGLTMLGGVTRMESSPTTAKAEFRVSVVGPIASASFGVALLCISYALPDGGTVAIAAEVLLYVGIINLILAAFNLLPATPLDGGKVLSSLIWFRTGSQATAIRWSARAGVAAGAAIVLIGIRGIQDGSASEYGFSFVFVGGFILVTAIRELQASPLYAMLAGVRVDQAMTPLQAQVAEWSTIADFLRTTPPPPAPTVWPVVGGSGHIVGLLTSTTVRNAPMDKAAATRAAELAIPVDQLVRLTPDEPVLPALQKVESAPLRLGIVIDPHGRVVGTLDSAALHRISAQQRAGLHQVDATA